jgi:hypothetical protein
MDDGALALLAILLLAHAMANACAMAAAAARTTVPWHSRLFSCMLT